ncbi:MAG TPA: hypothetical protein VLA19_17240 [Herpetosiphonaceae bacterium]|nr:hypothetical protein [Herpetosiphonaceae bacterium]
MAAHTPEPWELIVQEDDDGPYYMIEHDGFEICGIGSEPTAVDFANARVIKAAPKLLTRAIHLDNVLKTLAYPDEGTIWRLGGTYLVDAVQELRAAIAEATEK